MRVWACSSRGSPSGQDWFAISIEALRTLGWIEGDNLIIDRRYAESQNNRLPDLAAELIQLKPDVILTATTPAVLALKRTTSTIPIVSAGIADPVATGVVSSLARPGGNVTGISSIASELNGKRLQLLNEVAPKVRSVAVLTNPTSSASVLGVVDLRRAAEAMGIRLQIIEVARPEDLEAALERVASSQAQALLVPNEPILIQARARLAAFALKQHLPSVYGDKPHAEAGGLLSYDPDRADNFRRAAIYVDKILKGAKPADLPVEQPTKFELVINLKTAKALGLTIPPSLLLRADQVIE
jgi:putative ABC transport system substrate-binding protein